MESAQCRRANGFFQYVDLHRFRFRPRRQQVNWPRIAPIHGKHEGSGTCRALSAKPPGAGATLPKFVRHLSPLIEVCGAPTFRQAT
jgi:hypothetical protein